MNTPNPKDKPDKKIETEIKIQTKSELQSELQEPKLQNLTQDFYYEGPYIVFTEAYHLKRGYCCNSQCRHCPYKEKG